MPAERTSRWRPTAGALITEGRVDLLLFFWDPLEPQPHDPDVKALLRIAVVWNTPIACNRATADYLISSPLLGAMYEPAVPRYPAESLECARVVGSRGGLTAFTHAQVA